MREMYDTTQPLERANLELLEAVMKAMNADTQLLFRRAPPQTLSEIS